MYFTTRELIKERRRCSTKSVKFVDVSRLPIGAPKDCFANANQAIFFDVLGSGAKQIKVVAGWIVHRPIEGKFYGEAFQHWFNYDTKLKKYFDITPLHPKVEEEGVEYVLDSEILHYAKTRLADLEHTVGGDLTYADGKWFCEREVNGVIVQSAVKCLDIINIMHFKKSAPYSGHS